ncbi:hypothetical protein BS47DRAFT_1359174 [Hydnum rufescens UP504]|uniref:Uncharacterized protein n=1 Tax=Hydnum rufescens UP504 TaxID=1448309 RepID=A0A9P6E1A0_9AGAM|nr:hypothetical protein BS47DRAFT_1359174 [Hydnum rufescens UP504]
MCSNSSSLTTDDPRNENVASDGRSMCSDFSQEDLPHMLSNPLHFSQFMQEALEHLPEKVHAGVHGAMKGVKGTYHGTKINGKPALCTIQHHKKIAADAAIQWTLTTSNQGRITAWLQNHTQNAPDPQEFADLTHDTVGCGMVATPLMVSSNDMEDEVAQDNDQGDGH